MGFMTVKTYRTDQQISTLRGEGADVTYALTSCNSAPDATEGLVCTGSFEYRGRTYTDDLSGILNPPNDGQKISALTDPESPGSYVYVRSAVFGPHAAGRGAWQTGLIVVLFIAIAMIALAAVLLARNRRNGPTPDRG
jgi:hypothetical protein